MQYIKVYNELKSAFLKTLSDKEKSDMELFNQKWDVPVSKEEQQKLANFINNDMYGVLEELFETRNLNSNDRFEIFNWFFNIKYKNGLCNGKDYLIPLDIDFETRYIEKLITNSEYNLLSYLINNKDMEFLQRIRDDFDYITRTSRRCYGLLTSNIEINNEKKYNVLFDDMCIHDSAFCYVNEYLSECKELNEENIISIAKSLYMNGIYGKECFDIYNKAEKILSIINRRKEENSIIIHDEKNLLNEFIKIDESIQGIEVLTNIINLSKNDSVKQKKLYKTTNY